MKKENNCKCAVCSKGLHKKPSYIKKTKNICCGLECSSVLRKKTMKGENNHQYGLKGNLNKSYKGDTRITNYGYIKVKCNNHPFADSDGFCLEHRIVVEEYLKSNHINSEFLITVKGYNRPFLNPELVVHHIDENKRNNDIKNLQIMTKPEHTRHHNKDMKLERNKNGTFKSKKGK